MRRANKKTRTYPLFFHTIKNTIAFYVLNRRRAGDYIYLSSQLISPIVGFVTSIIAVKYLLPYELGVIQTVMLIPAYCSFFHFGVFNGLNRNIAFYEAQQNGVKIQAMVDASRRTAIANSLMGVSISVIVLIYFVLKGNSSLHLYSVAIVLGTLTFSPICTHYETIYRGRRAFMPLGILKNIGNGISLVLGFLPIAFGALGMIFRNATLPAVNFFLLRRKNPIKHKTMGKNDEVFDLARVGFPMLITGVLYVFFNAADRTIVALTLGPTAVGELALSGMIVAAIQILPVSMGALLYPRASYIFGLTKTSVGLRKFFFFSLAFNIITIVPLCLISYFTIGPMIEKFLPKYIEGIKAAKIYSLGSIFLIYYGVSIIIPVVRRNTPIIIAYVIAILMLWIFGLLFVKRGLGIEGIAWARFIASAFLCVFTIAYSYYLTTLDIKS